MLISQADENKSMRKKMPICLNYSTTSESYSGKEHQKLLQKIKRRSTKYGMTAKDSTKARLCFNLKNERLGVRFAFKSIKLLRE